MALVLASVAATPCPAQHPPPLADLTRPVALPGTWEFDVASIRPSGNPDRRQRLIRHPDDTEFVAQNASLSALLQFAFGVSETRVIGLPASIATARFDLLAKGDLDTDARFHKLNPDQQREAKQKMMQALLADRCKLAFHVETRELPVFALVVAKGGPKLQASDQKYESGWGGRTRVEIEGGDTLTRFAEELTRVSGRPVLNRTGLTGSYDIEVEWAADDDDDADAPQLFTAIREQLGLTLEPRKAPVDVVVVDHIEMPSEN
jgi:uncharacterized protein (TIGR03435 family)